MVRPWVDAFLMDIDRQIASAPQRWFAFASQRPPRRRSDVQESEIDHEVILFDPRTSGTYRFNRTAYSVWCQCDGTTPVERIGRTISELYGTDYDLALDHVDQLVTVFAETGLLESGGTP